MSKRRKDAPQNTTLLNFFVSGVASNLSVGKKNTKGSEKTIPSRGPLVKKEDESLVTLPQEVIVIESDEEVEVQLCDNSSDVEILEDVKPRKRARTVLRETCTQGGDGSHAKQHHQPQAKASASGSKNNENIFSVGGVTSTIPSISATSSRTHGDIKLPTSTDICNISELRQEFCDKGLSPELVSATSNVKPSYHSSECFRFYTGNEEYIFTDIPDDWDVNMGDDELKFIPEDQLEGSWEDLLPIKTEDEDEVPETTEGVEVCPICGMFFVRLDSSSVQRHVDACLDSPDTPAPGRAEASSSSKSLRPLSSFLTSNGPTVPYTAESKPKHKTSNADAFSVLMSSHNESSAWEEAQAHEDSKPTKTNRRKAPFYKVLQGMPISVDAFRYGNIPGVTAYFLTHAHSDHYTNLSSNWKNGPIYCSETTANLIIHMLSVDKKWVHPLPMNLCTEIPNTGGVKVTLIDANHCPGSCLFLFEGQQTINAGDSAYKSPFVGSTRMFRYLHCGDFRACPQHALHPAVRGRRIDTVYLDTTYLNPRYCFPPQPLVSAACAELARRIVRGESLDGEAAPEDGGSGLAKSSIRGWAKVGEHNGKGKQKAENEENVLIVVGTYTIGKERIVKAIAQALETKVYCDARKAAILRCQDDPELHALMTSNPLEAGVHVVPLGMVASDRFKDYMARWKDRWTRAVAFRPTGWTYTPPAGSGPHAVCIICYRARTVSALHIREPATRTQLDCAARAVRRAVLGALELCGANVLCTEC
ncbi:hypothetical protein EW145_g729 [Phellinidium pouzarii]|uniref:DNA repair metallo-beta-lactamase domain-containing protein n=1 Tax=Phellinidium pouzarii TaxID=167371 RepID=A0A4S4LH69_9AGAM|nr:hypothetical protein EW145_g729 [Phellinidium pouzarii]